MTSLSVQFRDKSHFQYHNGMAVRCALRQPSSCVDDFMEICMERMVSVLGMLIPVSKRAVSREFERKLEVSIIAKLICFDGCVTQLHGKVSHC